LPLTCDGLAYNFLNAMTLNLDLLLDYEHRTEAAILSLMLNRDNALHAAPSQLQGPEDEP
ncbi:hypothetical protein STEG23_003123, partial [Scotinomys teguina]